jgi:alpha-N-arabinofuranosidase
MGISRRVILVICALAAFVTFPSPLRAEESANTAESAKDSPPPKPPAPLAVRIDVMSRRPAINPYIYGQFIEHLGRCIYGGIWAEMLEDRKFFFPITGKYAPYKSLLNTPFQVVGASPWQIIGDAGAVTMTTKDPFVGSHTPKVDSGAGIRQRDLGVVKGKNYSGYVWLKGVEGDAGPVSITLDCGEGVTPQTHRIENVSDEYSKYEFKFSAGADADKASLELIVEGKSPVLVGTVSLMPADNIHGLRADTLEVLKQLDSPMYRWPGGNFVSGYDWRDGLGDRDRRPPRKNPAWSGVEHNDFGLDDFLGFCREVGAEPLVTVNTGFGDDYSAAQEVEYCNGSADTIGGGWRVKNGHADPYAVKHWCVGNEMFGNWQLGYMQQEQYVLKHNRVSDAMLKVDPTLKLIAVGDLTGLDPQHDPNRKQLWSEGMLRSCLDHMDAISEHFYCGRLPWTKETEIEVHRQVGMLRDEIRKKAEGHRELQKKLGIAPTRVVPIAMDEWNYWHRESYYGDLGCKYDLTDALGVAAGLHEFFRNTDIVHMASYAQTVNVIGCIKTTKTKAFLDSTALPLMAYRRHFGTIPVKVSGNYEEHYLDVVAALTADGKTLTIGVINSNEKEETVPTTIVGGKLGPAGRKWSVSGSDPRVMNDADNKRLAVVESAFDPNIPWTAPPYSFTILRVDLAP